MASRSITASNRNITSSRSPITASRFTGSGNVVHAVLSKSGRLVALPPSKMQ
jgi:hypothetical protein